MYVIHLHMYVIHVHIVNVLCLFRFFTLAELFPEGGHRHSDSRVRGGGGDHYSHPHRVGSDWSLRTKKLTPTAGNAFCRVPPLFNCD